MAIYNINTIQNPSDLELLTKNSNEYMYESLANLGQRFSPKGDGITTSSFTIRDIFGINESTGAAKIYIENNKVYLGLLDNSLNSYSRVIEIPYSLSTLVYSNTPIVLNKKINGIDYYKENMIMYSKDEQFFVCSIGCESISSENQSIELNIERYSVGNNKLLESVKLIEILDDDLNSEINLYHLYNNSDANDINSSPNKIDVYVNSDITNINDIITDIYDIILNYIKIYNNENTISDVIKQIVGEIQQVLDLNIDIQTDVLYNSDNNEGFSVTTENNIHSINSVLHYIYNQQIYMYPFVYEYYFNTIYRNNNNQLKLAILYSLFKRAHQDAYNADNSILINNFELYFPIDYSINYFINENDTYFIYSNETPITIRYSTTSFDIEFVNTCPVCKSNQYDTVILYKFNVVYNEDKTFNKIINAIKVDKLYTAPYISDNCWVINDIETEIIANGKDAGNPNIIMVYNDNKDNKNYQILSNSSILLDAKFEAQPINFTAKLFNDDIANSNGVDTYYRFTGYIPTLPTNNDDNEILKYAFIILILNINKTIIHESNKDRVEHLINEHYGANGLLTVFLKYNNEIDKFEIILDPLDEQNNAVLTLTTLTNVHSLIASHSDIENFNNNSQYVVTISNLQYKNDLNINSINSYITHQQNYVKYTHISDILDNIDKTMFNNSNSLAIYNVSNNNTYINKIPTSNNSYIINVFDGPDYTVYDYIPNTNVPTLNLAEVLVQDVHTLNRTNIITLDKSKNSLENYSCYITYYSYIGSSIHDIRKDILHIGTYTYSTNAGTTYLVNSNILFTPQTTVSIDFDNEIHKSYYTIYDSSNIKYSEYSYIKNYSNGKVINEPYNVQVDIYNLGTNTVKSETTILLDLESMRNDYLFFDSSDKCPKMRTGNTNPEDRADNAIYAYTYNFETTPTHYIYCTDKYFNILLSNNISNYKTKNYEDRTNTNNNENYSKLEWVSIDNSAIPNFICYGFTNAVDNKKTFNIFEINNDNIIHGITELKFQTIMRKDNQSINIIRTK